MSNKQPPRVQFDFEPDPIPESVPPPSQSFELPEGEPPSIDVEISEETETTELDLPSIEKEEIVENEIFQYPDNLAVRPDFMPPEEPKKPQAQQKRKGVNKDGSKRKPMSEEHKKKLALAREKARIARAEKSKQRAEEKALEKEEKELLKKQKVKRVQKLKAEVEDETPTPTSTKTPTIQQPQITMEDIQKAQFNAIMSYETLRKARKEEKKKAQMIEKQKEDMRRTIQQHTQPKKYAYRDGSNRWDGCY